MLASTKANHFVEIIRVSLNIVFDLSIMKDTTKVVAPSCES